MSEQPKRKEVPVLGANLLRGKQTRITAQAIFSKTDDATVPDIVLQTMFQSHGSDSFLLMTCIIL